MVEDDVDRAMRLLLNQKQINYVKSQTYRGPSRAQIIRKLINIGIETEKVEQKNLQKEWREYLQQERKNANA